jgi:peptidase E
MAELLLLSNSRAPGQAFLEHAADAIRSVLGGRARILFVPSSAAATLSFLLDVVPRFDVRTTG